MSQPVEYTAPIDIVNRAFQKVGQTRGTSFSDDTVAMGAAVACYDKLRIAELRRNVWTFSVRRAILRPYDPPMPVSNTLTTATAGCVVVVPAAWVITNNYLPGGVVSYSGKYYIALIPGVGQEPDISPTYWSQYFGPVMATPYDTTGNTSYYPGELVYTLSGTTVTVYMCVFSSSDVPTSINAWVSTTYYMAGDTVTGSNSTVYQSQFDFLLGTDPTTDAGVHWETIPTEADQMAGPNWLELDATVQVPKIIYPVGAGPTNSRLTMNIFFKPNGFLREAPDNPKPGTISFLGGPNNNYQNDWIFSDRYILSNSDDFISLRFAADIADVTQMEPMFCEGLACRIALELCESLTQSAEKFKMLSDEYQTFMTEARLVNGIEQQPTAIDEDDYVSCRR